MNPLTQFLPSALRRHLMSLPVAILLPLAASDALGGSFKWDGGGANSNWNTSANWAGNAAPAPATDVDLVFAGTAKLAPNNNHANASNFGSLTFDSTAGAFTLNGNAITLHGSIANNSSNAQTIDLSLTLSSGAHSVTTNAGADVSIGGVISGSGGLAKTGAGSITLANSSNSYSGGTTASSGMLNIGSGEDVGSLGAANSPVSVTDATLNFAQSTNSTNAAFANNFTLNAGSVVSSSYDGRFTLGSGTENSVGFNVIAVNGATTFAGMWGDKPMFLGGVVSGSGAITVQRCTTGYRTVWGLNFLNDNNTYRGTLTTTGAYSSGAGGVVVGGSNALRYASVVNNVTSGTVNNATNESGLVFNVTSANLGSLAGLGAFILNANTNVNGGSNPDASGDAVALTTGSNGTTTTYSGAISGSGSLTKTGAGTMTLSGSNTYTGTTTVSQGTLLINGTHNQGAGGANAGRILANSGATLGGSGTIKLSDTNGGTTGLSISGTLSPGDPAENNGMGTLTLDGSASARSVAVLEKGAKLSIRLNSGLVASKIALIGGQSNDVLLSGNVIDFTDVSGGGLNSGAHVIFSADVAGAFSGLTTNASGYITSGLTIGTGLSAFTNTSLRVVGKNIVLNLTNPRPPVPVALGFNLKSSGNTGMSPSDMAGPTGARFANWNNFNITATGGNLSNIVASNGAAVTGVDVKFSGGNAAPWTCSYSNPSNDTRMFDTMMDQYDTTPSTITVTGIPYGTYDVYFYVNDDGTARGGRLTAGGTTYFLRGGAGNPSSTGSGYVQSTDTTFNAGSDTQANYVKFTGLSGTLTATFVALNEGDNTQRLKVTGFQIVGTASVPSTPPSAPTGVTITATSPSSLALQWSAANTATQYQVFRSTTAGVFSFNTPLATVAATSTSYNDTTAVGDTIYYYVVRAVNGVGRSGSSTQISSPPPNLDSVSVSSPVIWPGGDTRFTWVIPNATNLTINSGGGPQPYATTGSLSVTPGGTTTYTFTATNAQGKTTRQIPVTVVPKPTTRDALWQWSVPITGIVSGETNDHPRAFLYIPPGCQRVRGVIIGQHNMLEEPVLEHTAVRQGLADANMAAIWVSPAFEGGFNFTGNPNTPALFQSMMDALAAESGYAELSKTPVVWLGHSAMSEAPYAFVAWDSQNSRATGAPRRCAAALSYKGYFPGKPGTPYPNSDLAGVPIMYIEGEYADAHGRATRTLALRNNTPGAIISFLADVGGGHFDWNDRSCEYIGMYLRKIGQYRLPPTAAADGTAKLQTINTGTQGWLSDRWRFDRSPTANPARVGAYTGNKDEAFWYFDQEHAEATQNYYLPRKTQRQLLGYTQNGTLVDQHDNHQQVDLAWQPDPAGDGLTFKLGTTFLNIVPPVHVRLSWWSGRPAGAPVGHASGGGPILINRIAGPVEQLSPDTFTLCFDRVGTNNFGANRSRDIWLAAVHPGDDTYVRAVQQSLLRIPFPLSGGAAQAITFPPIPDQPVGTASIPLTATTTGTATYAGTRVHFYVREGPAKVTGNTLQFTQIPPRTKFPVKVTVVATQYGRTIPPLLQTATPVTRSFYITAPSSTPARPISPSP